MTKIHRNKKNNKTMSIKMKQNKQNKNKVSIKLPKKSLHSVKTSACEYIKLKNPQQLNKIQQY